MKLTRPPYVEPRTEVHMAYLQQFADEMLRVGTPKP